MRTIPLPILALCALLLAVASARSWKQQAGEEQAAETAALSLPPSFGVQDTEEALLTLRRQVTFVEVPVTVKDAQGRLVPGLQKDDFQLYEEGRLQPITFFSDAPLALSAAVLVDTGMPNVELSKIQDTLTAMLGAFGPFDEIAVWQFSNTVGLVQDFTVVGEFVDNRLQATVQQLRRFSGQLGGVPAPSGPLQMGPTISGQPVDPGSRGVRVLAPERPARVLNDAIMTATLSLAGRELGRRKILFVLSDGTERGSDATDAQVLRTLMSYSVSVFGIGVGEAGMAVYRQLGKVRVNVPEGRLRPGITLGHALPQYAVATGGEVFPAYAPDAIERAYARATEQARYRYTLGFHSRLLAPGFRRIEVRVNRPGLVVQAREGYYPAPAIP